MRGLFTRRRVLLFASTLAILFLVTLAAGLSDLRFAPARPLNFGDGEIQPIQQTLAEIARQFNAVSVWQQIFLVGSFLLIVLLALIFMPSEMRKRLLRIVFRMGLLGFAILYFFDNFQLEAQMPAAEEIIAPMSVGEAGEVSVIPPEVFAPPRLSPLWSYLITFAILAVFAALTWRLWRVWTQARQTEETPLREFARIARASLDDLARGAAWEDVIVRSYAQMGEVVDARRGLKRQSEMTPHEFAQHLVAAGLPARPVQRLTYLFERVRYSPHSAGEREVAEAVACLNEIASAFGEKL